MRDEMMYVLAALLAFGCTINNITIAVGGVDASALSDANGALSGTPVKLVPSPSPSPE